jgi:hypothetical protein
VKVVEIADVSDDEGTIDHCNYRLLLSLPGNGIEEADGSIPFSSKKSLGFIFLKVRLKRFRLESFQGEEARMPPSSTVRTRRWRAPAMASGFA